MEGDVEGVVEGIELWGIGSVFISVVICGVAMQYPFDSIFPLGHSSTQLLSSINLSQVAIHSPVFTSIYPFSGHSSSHTIFLLSSA